MQYFLALQKRKNYYTLFNEDCYECITFPCTGHKQSFNQAKNQHRTSLSLYS